MCQLKVHDNLTFAPPELCSFILGILLQNNPVDYQIGRHRSERKGERKVKLTERVVRVF